MELLAHQINEPADFLQLARQIRAYRHEQDPKERKDMAYVRQGMGWNTIVNCRFCHWKHAVGERVAGGARRKYDIFGSNPAYPERISWPKVTNYILKEKLSEVVRFIEGKTPNVLEAVAELYKFVIYFNIPIVKAASVHNNTRLLEILAAMHLERGTTWASQLKWLLENWDSLKQKKTVILRSFADRWSAVYS